MSTSLKERAKLAETDFWCDCTLPAGSIETILEYKDELEKTILRLREALLAAPEWPQSNSATLSERYHTWYEQDRKEALKEQT